MAASPSSVASSIAQASSAGNQASSPQSLGPTSPAANGGTPRTPRTPGSSRLGSSVQPSPRSDLGRKRARNVPANRDQSPNDVPRSIIWGTSIDVTTTKEKIRKFFLEYSDESGPVYPRLLAEANARRSFFINLDGSHLAEFDAQLYDKMIQYATEIIGFLDAEATAIYNEEYPEDENIQIQTRPFNLRDRHVMRNLNPSDMEKLVSIKGMIIRLSSVIPDIQIGYFQCSSCNASEEVRIESGRIREPTVCKVCQAPQSMQLIHNRCIFADKQLVRLQESPEDIPEGETPCTVNLCAFDEMVDVSKPGDRVEVTGIYRAMPIRVKSSQRTLKCVYKTYLDVIHFQRSDKKRMGDAPASDGQSYFEGTTHSDTLNKEKAERAKALAASGDIYQKLIDSFAPSIYEMDDVKKGLLCLLFGGSNQDRGGATTGKFRGDINVLLVGDPGVSKSQLLQYVHRIAPRGIYTSGKGSSAVGLTAYVTKDPETKELVLESGALVLSDRGICCIDEFDKMSEATRAILHEAMEQQTISVAKAGIICSLNARTSILAAANPIQSRYNPQLSVVENMNLPPTLLSRFDLIYLVLDKPNPVTDRRLAKHLVGLYYADPSSNSNKGDTILDLETFADYVSYARNECCPVLRDEAVSALIDGYVQMRRISTNRHTISATPRQLESVIRLAEAHAKMRLSSHVEIEDVEEAFRLFRVATQSAATDPRTGKIDMDLINTGRSASSRQRVAQLVTSLRQLLTQRAEASVAFPALLELASENSNVDVTSQELQAAVRQLADEGVVTVRGHGHNMNIVRTAA